MQEKILIEESMDLRKDFYSGLLNENGQKYLQQHEAVEKKYENEEQRQRENGDNISVKQVIAGSEYFLQTLVNVFDKSLRAAVLKLLSADSRESFRWSDTVESQLVCGF